MAQNQSHPEQERRTRWSFAYHADNTWNWRAQRADGGLKRSEARLETLADALSDAISHGYYPWSRAEERRRERPEYLLDD